ncbi:MAG: carbohydrate-binding protein [Cyclobacteriaceae bacterium]
MIKQLPDFLEKQALMKKILRLSGLLMSVVAIISSTANAQEISPLLVGNNAWFTNPSDEVWALTGECGVKTIRIGGNSFNDNMPSNTSLLSWVNKIREIGAEPIVQVSQHGTPADAAAAAADVVRFFNVEKKGEIPPVKYWNIGNEPWLEANRPATSTMGPLVEEYFKPIAAAMKEVDPTIKIYGPDFAYYIENAIDDLFGGANDIAGKVPGKDYYYCDGISWHRYPQDESINLAIQGIADFETGIVKCKQRVDAVNQQHNRTGDDAVQWGIGEYNAKNGPFVHTWENGQMFAGVLGLCMKYEATYAATWSMFENGGSRTGTDYSFIDGENMTPRSSYRHMQFVAKHFTGSYLEGTSSSSHMLVYGAQNGDKTSVMIMNRESGAPLKYTINLKADGTVDDNVVLTVDGGLDDTYSDIIGQRTTHVLIFEGGNITKINYSEYHFDNELAPVESVISPATEAPSAPTTLAASAISYSELQVTWTDNSTNEAGFIIERGSGDNFEVIALVDADVTSFSDTDLDPETSYSYRIYSYNSAGESDLSNTATGTTDAIPGQAAYNGPHAIPGKIEAEYYNENGQGLGYNDTDAANQGGAFRANEWVDVDDCTDVGGGYNVGWIAEGEWLNYSIATVDPGTYQFDIRLASNTTGTKGITVTLDDKTLGIITPTNTGGWQAWQTYTLNDVELDGGQDQLLKLTFQGQEFNVNWFEFAEQEDPVPTNIDTKDLNSEFKVFYRRNAQSIHLDLIEPAEQVKISIYDLLGRKFLVANRTKFISGDVKLLNVSKGIYVLTVETNDRGFSRKIAID